MRSIGRRCMSLDSIGSAGDQPPVGLSVLTARTTSDPTEERCCYPTLVVDGRRRQVRRQQAGLEAVRHLLHAVFGHPGPDDLHRDRVVGRDQIDELPRRARLHRRLRARSGRPDPRPAGGSCRRCRPRRSSRRRPLAAPRHRPARPAGWTRCCGATKPAACGCRPPLPRNGSGSPAPRRPRCPARAAPATARSASPLPCPPARRAPRCPRRHRG